MENKYTFDELRKETDGTIMVQFPKLQLLSSSTLKIIAMVSMLIDHIGAAVLEQVLMRSANLTTLQYQQLIQMDNIFRSIGRLAFPIFCFLLVEGFYKTRDVKKYARNLFIFALISEVPFNLAFKRTLMTFNYQNVFFTLFIALLAMSALNFAMMKYKNSEWNLFVFALVLIVTIVGSMYSAEALNTDYGAIGVSIIIILYFFRGNRYSQAILGAVAFSWEMPASFAFIPIILYNGKRGLNLKYFFYAFYPVHLVILYFIAGALI